MNEANQFEAETVKIETEVPVLVWQAMDQVRLVTGIGTDALLTAALIKYLPEILNNMAAVDRLIGGDQLPGNRNSHVQPCV